jgi:hypothetical protein
MTYFKFTVLNQIKSAVDEEEVERVVERSIQRLRSSNVNGHLIQRFIVAMDKTLDETKLNGQQIVILTQYVKKSG